MTEDSGLGDHYPQRRHATDHHSYGYVNGTGGHGGGSARDSAIIEDDGAVHISHRISGINFTPTLHDSLVNEIRKLRNKIDKRENEIKLLNEELGMIRAYNLADLDNLRESHEGLQETYDALVSSSSRDIRSLRAQLERNAAVHVSEVKSLRSEVENTTTVVHDLRSKLDTTRRAKSAAEEQRDKWKSELEDLKVQSGNTKSDLERRLHRESEKVNVLEDLVAKMEAEIERSTMNSRACGGERQSVIFDDHRDETDDEDAIAIAPQNEPSSPVKTLFAEMQHVENDEEEESDEEPEEPEEVEEVEEFEAPAPPSPPKSPESSHSVPSVTVAQVLQSLRESVVETVEQGVQTEPPPPVPTIRVLSPTPPLTNAPLVTPPEPDVETVEQSTQTEIHTSSQSVQTDPNFVVSPMFKPAPQLAPPPATSPILRPQNSIRRSSHTVRWQDDKSIQTEPEPPRTAEIAIQTDPFVALTKVLKPVLKTPTSEAKEVDKEKVAKHGRLKLHDGPSRRTTVKVVGARRLEAGQRGSVLFASSEIPSDNDRADDVNGHINHERRSSGSSIQHSTQHTRKGSSSQLQNDLRRGRQPHSAWVKQRPHLPNGRTGQGVQLHAPIRPLHSNGSIHPPLPIPQRSSSKFRVVLPIVRDRPTPEETLHEVAEEMDEPQMSEEERTRREVNAFLARPPRKTVRQIKSAVNLRAISSFDTISPAPDRGHGESAHTPMHAEVAPKSFSTPRRQPKRMVKLRPSFQDTPVSSVSPVSSYFPTSEEMGIVDEIAKCMVGEYMYKYVRRRRKGNFTWRKSPAKQPGYNEDVEESTVRHKRWVWLQPYDKMILWSSTQPSQSNFLQRAQVKKRVVTGVLDVRDDTPLTTSSSNSGLPTPAHGRSIVVLTPTQAIKFTALTRDRHISWLTALNFIVHNDPADLIIPRSISTSPNHGSVWSREPTYPRSATASSVASSQGTSHLGSSYQHQFNSYTVRKNSLPDFVPVHPLPREEASPLGYKQRYDDQYATPPSVPRIPTGRRFEGGRERSGSGDGSRDWEDPTWQNGRETIRMDAFVKRTAPRLELDIDDTLFREF